MDAEWLAGQYGGESGDQSFRPMLRAVDGFTSSSSLLLSSLELGDTTIYGP